MYVGMKVPYTTGIDEVKPYEHRLFHECALKEFGREMASVHGQLFALMDLMCDILFVFDLFINFLTARWIIETKGREHWMLIDDLREIRRMYMWDGWVPQFWTDLIGVIPWQYIDCFQSDGTDDASMNFVKILRLLRLLKV